MVGFRGESGEESSSNRTADGRGKKEWHIVAPDSDPHSRNDGEDNERQDHRNTHYTRRGGRHAFDGLKPDRNVVNNDEEGSAETENESRSKRHATLANNPRWNCGVVPFPNLNANESDKENTSHDEKRDDASILPFILGSTPLKREKKTDNSWNEDDSSQGVELIQPFLETFCAHFALFWMFEEDEDGEDSESANRKIYIETPSPAHMISQCSSQQGPNNRSNAIHGAKKAIVCKEKLAQLSKISGRGSWVRTYRTLL